MTLPISSLFPETIKALPPIIDTPQYRPRCSHNTHLDCHWQPCVLTDRKWTRLLDAYCERFGSRPSVDCSEIHGPRDAMRQTTPNTTMLDVAGWFDDRDALELYARWRVTNAPLRITRDVCRTYRDAWCHWLVRLQPLGVRRPAWMRGWDRWARVSENWGMEKVPYVV